MTSPRSAPVTLLALACFGVVTLGLFSPVPVKAQFCGSPCVVTEVGTQLAQTTISAVKNTITAIAAPISAAADVAMQVDKYVLQPLAFVVSGQLLQAIMGDVINFVNGSTNGTGEPQYVQDYNGNLQRLGDTQASSFFASYSKNSNSPFAGTIVSSLRTNYLQQTSTGGFFAANRSTLGNSSPNINRFLAGGWEQGGIRTWFALTTQTQNNPYTLHQSSQGQLGNQVYGAQNARQQELAWGRGYLGWCGPVAAPASLFGASDPCVNPDGSARSILTPPSLIQDMTTAVVTSPIRKLEGLGELGREVGSVASNMGKILTTIGTGAVLLNTFSGKGSSSYYATSQGGVTSYVAEYRSNPSYLGISQASVFQGAATLPSSGADLSDRVQLYETSWNSIGSSVEAAASSVSELARVCRAQAKLVQQQSSEDPALAQFVLAAEQMAQQADEAATTTVRAAREQVTQAKTIATTARAFIAKVQKQLTSGTSTPTTVEAYTGDLSTIQSMRPSAVDVAEALQESQTMRTAGGSGLNVGGGTLIDRMNLLNGNAVSLRSSVCTIPSSNSSS